MVCMLTKACLRHMILTTACLLPRYRSMVLDAGEDMHAAPMAGLSAALREDLAPLHAGILSALRLDHSCVWIFWGSNAASAPMPGRAEHVDDVQAAGTLHWQAAGSKRWRLRSCGGNWPIGSLPPGEGAVSEILAEAGSLLLINTALLLHTTTIPSQQVLTLSYAWEFELEGFDRLGCPISSPSPPWHTLDASASISDRARDVALSSAGALVDARTRREWVADCGRCLAATNVVSIRSVCAWCGTPTGLDRYHPLYPDLAPSHGDGDGGRRGARASGQRDCACLCCSLKRASARALGRALVSCLLTSRVPGAAAWLHAPLAAKPGLWGVGNTKVGGRGSMVWARARVCSGSRRLLVLTPAQKETEKRREGVRDGERER